MKMLAGALLLLAACGGDDTSITPGDDTTIQPVDANTDCNAATVLPATWRPIANVAATTVSITNNAGTLTGTIDATAGGSQASAADNPYVYVNLETGAKVEVNDLDARDSLDWDIALKRSSLRSNSGDSGGGRRKLAVVTGATSVDVTAPAASLFFEDDFTDENCEYVSIPGGEPMTAFGEWYDYDLTTHQVTPRGETYVIERADGKQFAFRFTTYYGGTPAKSGMFGIESKAL